MRTLRLFTKHFQHADLTEMLTLATSWSVNDLAVVLLDKCHGDVENPAPFYSLVTRLKGLNSRIPSHVVLMSFVFGAPVGYCLTCGC